jgi:ATP adenylyltransferase
MPLDHLWATWRANYVTGVTDSRTAPAVDGEILGQSLFERILAAPGTDAEKFIVARGEHSFVLLNRFPYTAGHLMVLPLRAVAELEELTADEHTEIWANVTRAVVALKAAFGCDGVNVGLNLGVAAGGSQSDHLHVHCVPRWVGDANFISVAAETRVLPVPLDQAWEQLTAAWEAAR